MVRADKARLCFGLGRPRSQKTSQIRSGRSKRVEASQGQRSAVLCKFKTAVCLTPVSAPVTSRESLYLLTQQVRLEPNSSLRPSPDRRRTAGAFHRLSWFTSNSL